MVELEFKAKWLPTAEQFHVLFKAKGETHIELMSKERYFQFCDALDDRLEVSGWTFKFNDADGNEILEGPVQAGLRKYFRDVRKSFEFSLKGYNTIFHL